MPEVQENGATSDERESDIVAFAPFLFDRAERMLTRDGEEIRLPPRVIGVLEFLLDRRGKIVSRRDLMEGVWSGTTVTETSLTEAISLLRQALGDDVQSPQYLETVHRRGYRFRNDAEVPRVETSPEPERKVRWRWRSAMIMAVVTGGVLTIAIAIAIVRPSLERDVPKATHATIATTGNVLRLSSPAISPNGRDVVYFAEIGSEEKLYHRSLDGFATRAIAPTRDSYYPFFSPDGKWVGYFSNGFLMKVELSVGTPIQVCRADGNRGATWTRDGWIIYASSEGGLARVSANGGTPEPLTTPNYVGGEFCHSAPQALPDGKSVLFTIISATFGGAKAAVLSLETKRRRVILENAAGARWIPGGYLAWLANDAVTIAPFDASGGRVTAAPIAALRDISWNSLTGLLLLSVADDGTLVYFSGGNEAPAREIVRLETTGRIAPLSTPVRNYRNLRLAPDGRRAAITIVDGERSDVWIADLETGILNRISFEGFNVKPTWSHDGEWVYYSSNRRGPYNIYRRRAGGEGGEERITSSAMQQFPSAWSPDGKVFVVEEKNEDTGVDIELLERTSDGSWKSRPFVRTADTDTDAQVSPDGRWIAYASCGINDCVINLQDFPHGRGKWQMSTKGGRRPFWSADGDTLYYQNGPSVVAVPLTFRDGAVVRGREKTIDAGALAYAQRSAVPDELTIVRASEQHPPCQRELRMITEWTAGMSRRQETGLRANR